MDKANERFMNDLMRNAGIGQNRRFYGVQIIVFVYIPVIRVVYYVLHISCVRQPFFLASHLFAIAPFCSNPVCRTRIAFYMFAKTLIRPLRLLSVSGTQGKLPAISACSTERQSEELHWRCVRKTCFLSYNRRRPHKTRDKRIVWLKRAFAIIRKNIPISTITKEPIHPSTHQSCSLQLLY